MFAEKTIAIPQIVQTPTQEVAFGFRPFKLQGLEGWSYQPTKAELIVQTLREERQTLIAQGGDGDYEQKPEDILVARLIDIEEVDYQAHAELIYDLAAQVTARLRSYLHSESEVRDVLIAHGKSIAAAVFAQMREHMWRTKSGYRVTLAAAFTMLRPQTYDASAGRTLPVGQAPARLSEIKQYVFNGFARGCYPLAKFDSDPERRLAVLLEREPSVEKWMKPGPGQFRIEDAEFTGATWGTDWKVTIHGRKWA